MTEVEAISSAMLFQATQIQLPPSPSQLPSPRLRSKPSRLPVLRKSASHSGGSLRPQLSRDHLSASNVEIHQAYLLPSSPRALLKRAATTSRIPSQSSSSSSSSDQGGKQHFSLRHAMQLGFPGFQRLTPTRRRPKLYGSYSFVECQNPAQENGLEQLP